MKPLQHAFVFAKPLPFFAALAVTMTPVHAAATDFIHANYAKQRVTSIAAVPVGSLTIDGDLSDWAGVPVKNGVIDEILDHSLGPLNGNVRGAATFRFAHDDTALYIGVDVADGSLVPSKSEIYNGDAIEVFLDLRSPDAGLGEMKFGPGCYQIIVAAPIDGVPLRHQEDSHGGKTLVYDVATKATTGGYSVEIKLPYASLEGVDAARLEKPFGFDVSIDDFDPLASGGVGERRSWCWSGNPDQWEDGTVLGIVDPTFTDKTPSPLLRTSPAVYEMASAIGLKGDQHLLVAGSIAPVSTPAPAMDFRVACRPAAKLGMHHDESTDYPGLGVTIHRAWWAAESIPPGSYKSFTLYATGLSQLVKFNAESKGVVAGKPGTPFAKGQTAANKTISGSYVLPNGARITPVGKHIALPGDMPESFVWLDKTHLAVNTGGFHDQGVDVIDVTTNKVIQTLPVFQTWGGMALMDGNTLLVPGGHAAAHPDPNDSSVSFTHIVHPFVWRNATLTVGKDWGLTSPSDKDLYVAGVAVVGSTPYITNLNGDKLYSIKGSPETGYNMAGYTGTAYRPNAIAASPNGKSIAVANWGDETVGMFDPATLASQKSIKVGSHPIALAYSPNGADNRLFVVCSGSNSVSIIDNGQVDETIKTSLDPTDLVGSTPIALAISPDGKRLFVANADNNNVCVVDTSVPGKSRVLGFIPTGWYPSALTVSADGRKLYIGIGKGLGFSANPKSEYIPSLQKGLVSVVDLPDAAHLDVDTRRVVANAGGHRVGQIGNVKPTTLKYVPMPADADLIDSLNGEQHLKSLHATIKHIVYIIRENRTYDQVLGDDSRGNGDPSLAMYGKDVTPNVHKLVKDFVLLDNIYCNGEVSENGHQWCDSAYATDFVDRAWLQSYSGKDEPDADDRLSASPAGYLWDNCARHGLSYYSYGEFSSFTASPNSPPIFTGEGPLKGHCSDRYALLPWDDRDTKRASIFIDDLHKAEKTGKWPNFMVMSLPEDHTHGLSSTVYTPPACVASNDLAVGQMVEAVSHSRFWKDTAFFIIEDDAQNGPDHVDAHRTVALVISPYIKHGGVDHTLYTTASMVRTMEDILGLPPMTQFDENATPMWNAFQSAPVMTAWAHVGPHIDLMAKNQAGPAAIESAKLDFTAPDRADPDKLNQLLWHAWKPGVPMPAPVRSGVLMAAGR